MYSSIVSFPCVPPVYPSCIPRIFSLYPLVYTTVCSPCIPLAFPSLCVPPIYPPVYPSYIPRTSPRVCSIHSQRVSFPKCSLGISPGISIYPSNIPRISPRVFPIHFPLVSLVMCSGLSFGISIVFPLLYLTLCSHAFPVCFLFCELRYSQPHAFTPGLLDDLHTFPVPHASNTTELVIPFLFL